MREENIDLAIDREICVDEEKIVLGQKREAKSGEENGKYERSVSRIE
jgi:hypothetical protein